MTKKIYLFSISSHEDTISINSLDIKLLKPKIDFSQYDYLIITSKQTSKVLQQYCKEDYIEKKALCVSTQSAKSYENLDGQVLEIGAGYGDNLIDKIKLYPKSVRWLYLRAKIVASDFVQICKNEGYNIDEIVVYESSCSKEIQNINVEDDATLIFTSPSSIKCFMKNNLFTSRNRVIVIGSTTAKTLPKEINYQQSELPTIKSCLNLV